MALEDDLDPLDEFEWELGGLRFDRLAEAGDEGLDDLPEIEDDASDAALDGLVGGQQRLGPRSIVINRWYEPVPVDGDESDRAAAIAAELDALREVVSPLPDRAATRLLRWRRRGEPAKRIAVRPAVGKPLEVPGDRRRLLYDQAAVRVRLTAPDPVALSDEYHQVTFEAGETIEIVNAGSFTAVLPTAWWLTAPGAVAIEHLDFPDEYIRFPTGPVTVSRGLTIDAPGKFGLCWGRGSDEFPKPPLLRPGVNHIKASAPCTFNWRDTW